MIRVDHSDPQWLQRLLEHAVRKKWCLQMHCTTCGAHQIREAIGTLDTKAEGPGRFIPLSFEDARTIVTGLRECVPAPEYRMGFEDGVQLLLYTIWCEFGDRAHTELFPVLKDTWSGEVLGRMRAHYARRQEKKRLHLERQGVRQRDE